MLRYCKQNANVCVSLLVTAFDSDESVKHEDSTSIAVNTVKALGKDWSSLPTFDEYDVHCWSASFHF